MRVRMLQTRRGTEHSFALCLLRRGQIYELDGELADQLILAGIAEPITIKKQDEQRR